MSEPRPERPASVESPVDGLSPTARAAYWASRIMTVSFEMVIPGLLGYGLDTLLGTRIVFMLIGFALGMYVAIRHLLYSLNSAAGKKPADR